MRDCVRSAFDSAGQRCSAARVLFLQDDAADDTIDMLLGAVEALDMGDPFDYATDIGPVIDEESQDRLDGYKARMRVDGRELLDLPMPEHCRDGSFVTPAVYEIDSMDALEREVFGPVLHVVRYEHGHLDKVIEAINASGLRPDARAAQPHGAVADYVAEQCARRQPLRQPQPDRRRGGGAALRRRRAVGHRAQGWRAQYLKAYATERVRTTDITATGGNLQLLSGASD